MFKGMGVCVLCVSVVLVLGGCATHPVGMSGQQMTQMRQRGLVVAPVTDAAAVTVKTKTQAVGGMLLGSLIGSAVAGSPGSTTAQGLRESQEAGMQASALTQQVIHDHGIKREQQQTPAFAMHEDLVSAIAGLGLPSDDESYRVVITQDTWELSYGSLFGSDNYGLHYELEASVLDQGDAEVAYTRCTGESEEGRALDAWRADDYAAVKAYAREVGDKCSAQLLNAVGLHG